MVQWMGMKKRRREILNFTRLTEQFEWSESYEWTKLKRHQKKRVFWVMNFLWQKLVPSEKADELLTWLNEHTLGSFESLSRLVLDIASGVHWDHEFIIQILFSISNFILAWKICCRERKETPETLLFGNELSNRKKLRVSYSLVYLFCALFFIWMKEIVELL
jgi:hypothetical protein